MVIQRIVVQSRNAGQRRIIVFQLYRAVVRNRTAVYRLALQSLNAAQVLRNLYVYIFQCRCAGYITDGYRIAFRILDGVALPISLGMSFVIAGDCRAFYRSGSSRCQCRIGKYGVIRCIRRSFRIRNRPVALIGIAIGIYCYLQVIVPDNLVAKGVFRDQSANRNIIRSITIPVFTLQRNLAVFSFCVLFVQCIIMDLAKQRNTRSVVFALF